MHLGSIRNQVPVKWSSNSGPSACETAKIPCNWANWRPYKLIRSELHNPTTTNEWRYTGSGWWDEEVLRTSPSSTIAEINIWAQRRRLKHSQTCSTRSAQRMIHLSCLLSSSASWSSPQPVWFTPCVTNKQFKSLDIGHGNIPAAVLITCTPELTACLAKLFQYSHNTGI